MMDESSEGVKDDWRICAAESDVVGGVRGGETRLDI